MKKVIFLFLISFSVSAQISMNPLSKYVKRVNYVFDSVDIDKTHQILVICGDSVLITLPDTAMLNADWGTYQQMGYGYQPDDYQYNLDIRFNGSGTVFLSDSLYVNSRDSIFVTKELTSNNIHTFFCTTDRSRTWIQYVPHTNKFFIYRREQL